MPPFVDADAWLQAYDGHSFARKVRHGGSVTVADVPYYLKAHLVGQQVGLRVDAATGQFVVEANGQAVQRLAIKGLGLGLLPFTTFVDRLCADLCAVKRAPRLRFRQRA